jgi:hypothetical protein
MRPAAGSISISVVAVAAAVVAAAAIDAVSGTCQSDLGRCLGQGQCDVAAMARMVCEAAWQAAMEAASAADRCVQSYGTGCRPQRRGDRCV